MENGAYEFRQAVPQIVKGAVIGAVPGTIVGALIPAVAGFALLGLTTPQRVTIYFSVYLALVLLGGLLGAAVGGSFGVRRCLTEGCPEIEGRQMRMASIVGVALSLALAFAVWMLARQLIVLFF